MPDDNSYLHVSHLQPKERVRDVETKQCKRGNVQCVVLIIVSLCVNAGLIIYLACASLHSENQVAFVGDINNSVCISCSHDDAKTLLGTSAVIKVGDYCICCIRNSEHLQKLVSVFTALYAHESSDKDREKPDGETTPPGVHLYLDPTQSHESDLLWTNDYGYGAAFVDNLEMKNGSLKIKQEGDYFLYSFLSFKSRETRNEDIKIRHKVTRIGEDQTSVLLERDTILSKEKETFATSYLGSAFRLKPGDLISVDVSNDSAVYRYVPANFVGLTRLGP